MSTAKASRRWWRPQFSLRTLLLVITALGLLIPGGVGWWRRPFEVVELTATSEWKHDVILEWEGVPEKQRVALANKGALPSALPTQRYKQIAQVYREVTGEFVRHGTTVTYDYKGRKLREERWHHGQLHGRWTDWHPDGSVIAFGEYDHGKPHGSWVELRRFDQLGRSRHATCTTEYRDGMAYSSATREGNEVRVWLSASGMPGREQVWDATSALLLDDVPYSFVLLSYRDEQIAQPVPHGLARSWHGNGQLQEEVTFDKGRRVGPARGWYADGAAWYEGAFEAGLEHGRWTWWNADGTVLRSAEFSHGRLARRDGSALPPLLLPEIGIETPQCVHELDKATAPVMFSQVPLRDAVKYLTDVHNVNIAIDASALAAVPLDTPLTHNSPPRMGRSRGFTLRSELQILLEPIGLVPVVRYESLVLTTPEEAATWRDRTGTTSIATSETSAFAGELQKRTQIEFNETPLRDAIKYLVDLHQIRIRLKPEAADELKDLPCTMVVRNVSLAAGLGFLLDQHDLQCEEMGNELLIGPRAERSVHQNAP